MSLINQMLKDLAQRTKPVTTPEVVLSGLHATAYSKPNKRKLLLSFIITAIAVLWIFNVMAPKPRPASSVISYHLTVPEPILAKIAENNTQKPENVPTDISLEPVVLTGITLQTEKELTTFRLFLSEHPLYRITGNGKDRLVIVLEKTSLVASLPQLDTLNSAVKLIRMINQSDGSLKVILALNTGVELKQLQLSNTDKHAELQIDLSNPPVTFPSQNEVVEEQQPLKKVSYISAVDNKYQQAMQLSAQGQVNEAITLLSDFLLKYPNFLPARKSLASLFLKTGDSDSAQAVIEVGLQQQPFNPTLIQFKAKMLVDKGNIKQALNLLQKAPPPVAENTDYHALIAALYQRQNKFLLAEKIYEQLLTIKPNNPLWWLGLGIARESLNKNKLALEAYKRADSSENLSPELKVYAENRINALH